MDNPNEKPENDFTKPILKSPKTVKPEVAEPKTPRLFLREPGWRVALKVGSDRLFCYMTIPGEKYYHRIMDGEIHLTRDDEKICLPCAERRGLLAFSPKPLRDPEPAIQFLLDQIGEDEILVALTWDESQEEGEEPAD
ncbi:MAG: hypothetical protein ACKO5E_10065 [bacterium]